MKNKIIYYILFLAIGLVVGFYIDKALSIKSSQQEETNTQQESESSTDNQYVLSKNVSGALVWWDQDNGFEDLKTHVDEVNTVNPLWYKVESDGSISQFTGSENQDIIDFAHKNNIQILPIITNDCEAYNPEEIIKYDSKTEEHIANIMHTVETNNYDGIMLDYECLSGIDVRPNYSNFITKLAEALHADGKLLSIPVHVKTSDEGEWEGPATQDWDVINKVADEVSLMAYDYHWETSEAGDIAPLSWLEESLDYATEHIDKSKLYLGINFYAYDWVGESAQSLTYNDVEKIITRYNPEILTSQEGEKYFTYTQDENVHTVYFADHDTIKARLELVNQYDIAGASIWRLGQDDSDNWNTIKEVFKQ